MTIEYHERVITPEPARDGTYSVPIAVNDDVGDGKPLDIAGIRLDAYRENPVVLYAHDRTSELPVGRTTSIRRTNRGLVADFEFLPNDERAQRVKNAWDKGFLRAASVGVRQTREGPELVEWSIVPVPADRDCVRGIVQAMLDDLVVSGDDDAARADPPDTDDKAPAAPPDIASFTDGMSPDEAQTMMSLVWKHRENLLRPRSAAARRSRLWRLRRKAMAKRGAPELFKRSENMVDSKVSDAAAALSAYLKVRRESRKSDGKEVRRSSDDLAAIRQELDRRFAARSEPAKKGESKDGED